MKSDGVAKSWNGSDVEIKDFFIQQAKTLLRKCSACFVCSTSYLQTDVWLTFLMAINFLERQYDMLCFGDFSKERLAIFCTCAHETYVSIG